MSTQLPVNYNFEGDPSEVLQAPVTTAAPDQELDQFAAFNNLGEAQYKAPVKDLFVDTYMENGQLCIRSIGKSFSDADRDLILEHLPTMYNVYSPHVDGPILNEHHLFIHLDKEGLRKDPLAHVVTPSELKRRELSEASLKFKREYGEWEKLCSDRKHAIKQQQLKVRELIAQRDAITNDYNNQIAQQRILLAECQSTPIPTRPIK